VECLPGRSASHTHGDDAKHRHQKTHRFAQKTGAVTVFSRLLISTNFSFDWCDIVSTFSRWLLSALFLH